MIATVSSFLIKLTVSVLNHFTGLFR